LAMKRVILTWMGAGVVAASATSTAARASVQNAAAKWLSAHPAADVNQGELAELQSANPEAYAIVEALLTKRSLGLLDPKHPTASFAAPPAAATGPKLTGAAAFANLVTPEELANVGHASTASQAPQPEPALAYPDMAAAPAHHDWLNWKPENSDHTMVANVLGAVAEIKGKAAKRDSGSSLANDEDLLSTDSNPSPSSDSAPSAVDETPQTATVEKQSSYLDNTGLSSEAPPLESSQTPQQPQLRLASTSTSSTVRKNMPTAPAESMLSNYLGGSPSPRKVVAAVAEAPVAATPEQNPYTVGLW